MRFVSTRGGAESVSLAGAIDGGTAPDGGLWVPDPLPAFGEPEPGADLLDFGALAAAASAAWFQGEGQGAAMARAVRPATNIDVALRPLDSGVDLLDLTRGPSAAFKDVGARFLAALWRATPLEGGGERTVLVATSGDTGGAVAAAVWRQPGLRAVIVYPEGRVSEVQRRQFTTLGGNVTAVAIPGAFDDAQAMVRTLFRDRAAVRDFGLVSANSINPGRLLPQTLYYLHLTRMLRRDGWDPIDRPVIVPTGNVGNLMAAVWARAMGAPLGPIHAAVNENDALVRAVAGTPDPGRETVPTDSSAMDVGRPSNLERLTSFADTRGVELGALLTAHSIPQEEARAAQARAARDAGVLIDPHTAVGYAVALRLRRAAEGVRPVVLETAHPAKFPDVLKRVTGRTPEAPPSLQQDLQRHEVSTRIAPEPGALAQLIAALDRP